MGQKVVCINDEAESFDKALVVAVSIVEREQFKVPWVEITPRWNHTDEFPEGRLIFDVEVGSSFDTETNQEITKPRE